MSDLLESRFPVCADCRFVELEDSKHDVVEADGGEGVVEHEARRLRAVAFVSGFSVSDENAELRPAVAVVYVRQRRGSDRLRKLAFVDGEMDVAGFEQPGVPFLLLEGERPVAAEVPGALEVVDPTLASGKISFRIGPSATFSPTILRIGPCLSFEASPVMEFLFPAVARPAFFFLKPLPIKLRLLVRGDEEGQKYERLEPRNVRIKPIVDCQLEEYHERRG